MKVMYTAERKRVAVATYRRHKSYAKALRLSGHPSRHALFDWVRGSRPGRRKAAVRALYRRHTWRVKPGAADRMPTGEAVVDIAADPAASNHMPLHEWMHAWRPDGEEGPTAGSERKQREGYGTRAQREASSPDDPGELRRLAARPPVDKAVLERELDPAEKDAGVIPGQPADGSRTMIIQSLRNRLPLAMPLDPAGLRANSHRYAGTALARPDGLAALRASVHGIARPSGSAYGSPRVRTAPGRAGIVVSEKVVRRVMKQRIPVRYAHRRRRYSSHEGETTPAPRDLVGPGLHADEPNRLWPADAGGFAARTGKVHPVPIIDCHDGKVVACPTGRSPDKRLTRSMSRKGRSPDNAACEGFFGRMKTEMFHERTWNTTSEPETAIHGYMDFYNNHHIKTGPGGITINEHRNQLESTSTD